MIDLDIAPSIPQILGHEASMASVRGVFAAEKAALGEDVSRNGLLYLTTSHEL
jgi:hypothetical protein